MVFSLFSSSNQTKFIVPNCFPVLSLTLTLLNFEASGVILLPVSLSAVIIKHLTGFLQEKIFAGKTISHWFLKNVLFFLLFLFCLDFENCTGHENVLGEGRSHLA